MAKPGTDRDGAMVEKTTGKKVTQASLLLFLSSYTQFICSSQQRKLELPLQTIYISIKRPTNLSTSLND